MNPNSFIYKLVDRKPVPATGFDEVRHYFEPPEKGIELRRVAFDEVDGCVVSTVFLVFNPQPFGEPRLFETMVFAPGGEPYYQDRSVSWEDAESLHQMICEAIRCGGLKREPS